MSRLRDDHVRRRRSCEILCVSNQGWVRAEGAHGYASINVADDVGAGWRVLQRNICQVKICDTEHAVCVIITADDTRIPGAHSSSLLLSALCLCCTLACSSCPCLRSSCNGGDCLISRFFMNSAWFGLSLFSIYQVYSTRCCIRILWRYIMHPTV